MPDKEKVITHFNDAIEASGNNKWCFVRVDVINDALELLKRQEPRVLTLKEVQNDCPGYVYLEWYGYCSCCIKDECESDKSVVYFVYGIEDDYFQFSWDTYGDEWRCWTAMPTDEQRKAVKWDE